jgi:hypothetical protein
MGEIFDDEPWFVRFLALAFLIAIFVAGCVCGITMR